MIETTIHPIHPDAALYARRAIAAKGVRDRAYLRAGSAVDAYMEARHNDRLSNAARADIRDRLWTARDAFQAAVNDPHYYMVRLG